MKVTPWPFLSEYRSRLRCSHWQPIHHAASLSCIFFFFTLCRMKSCVSCCHRAGGSSICPRTPFEEFLHCPPQLAISSSLHISGAELIRQEERLAPLLSTRDLSYQCMQEANRSTPELVLSLESLVCWGELICKRHVELICLLCNRVSVTKGNYIVIIKLRMTYLLLAVRQWSGLMWDDGKRHKKQPHGNHTRVRTFIQLKPQCRWCKYNWYKL